MKIITEIPDSSLEDVTEYCRATGTDLQGRMQQELNTFIANAKEQISQWRQTSKDVDKLQKAIKEFCGGD